MLTGIAGIGMRGRDRARRPGTAGGGFALPGTDAPRASAPPGVTASDPAALLSLLALQAEDEAAERNRRAHDHARALLDEMTKLQSALLAGHADANLLARLTALASAPTEACDPRLAEIAAWVSLRASVVLARLMRV